MSEQPPSEAVSAAEDIFSRPSGFRRDVVLAVWESAEPVKGKEGYRHDWRNGNEVGPWKQGELRNGIWDMGHKEAWYKVVERLKKVEGITRADVLDEFNNLDNLGVEDPVTNRELGVNSRKRGVPRLPYAEEEEILFGNVPSEEKEPRRQRFHAQIDAQEQGVEQRVKKYGKKENTMSNERHEHNEFDAPKRVIVWDSETTGLSHRNGDKIVEIGAIEMIDGVPTGKQYHQYINPERPISKGATAVHGITDEDVKDSPIFKDIAQDFLDFVGDAPLVAHNASFDMGFLNAELSQIGRDTLGDDRKIDTLRVARKLLPELKSHTLDTLADHFNVDRSGRDDFHGGLVDTIILAEVYQGLVGLAKEQNVSLLEAEPKNARMAPDAEARRFDAAVEDEKAMHPAWNAAPEKGFADRERERQERPKDTAKGV